MAFIYLECTRPIVQFAHTERFLSLLPPPLYHAIHIYIYIPIFRRLSPPRVDSSWYFLGGWFVGIFSDEDDCLEWNGMIWGRGGGLVYIEIIVQIWGGRIYLFLERIMECYCLVQQLLEYICKFLGGDIDDKEIYLLEE